MHFPSVGFLSPLLQLRAGRVKGGRGALRESRDGENTGDKRESKHEGGRGG